MGKSRSEVDERKANRSFRLWKLLVRLFKKNKIQPEFSHENPTEDITFGVCPNSQQALDPATIVRIPIDDTKKNSYMGEPVYYDPWYEMIAENKIQFKADVHRSQLKGSSTERFTNHVSKVRELQNGVNAESSSTVCVVSYSVDCVDRHKESLYEAQTGFRSEECVTNSSREIKESLHEAQTEVTSEECISKSINRIKESSDEALTEIISEECFAKSSNATKESSHEPHTEIVFEECMTNSTNEINESLHEAHTAKIISKECIAIASVPTAETKTVASAKPRGKKRNNFKKNKIAAACPQKVDGWNEFLQNIQQNNLILNADFTAAGKTIVKVKYPRFIG